MTESQFKMIAITSLDKILPGDFIVKYPNTLLGQVPKLEEIEEFKKQYYINHYLGNEIIVDKHSEHEHFFYRTIGSFNQ